MSPSENCFGLSTSARQDDQAGARAEDRLALAWNFSRAGTKSHASISLSRVVDSAARHDEAIDLVELERLAHLDRLHAALLSARA